jgi:hypothetical protein
LRTTPIRKALEILRLVWSDLPASLWRPGAGSGRNDWLAKVVLLAGRCCFVVLSGLSGLGLWLVAD